jgi:hypothetical protein
MLLLCLFMLDVVALNFCFASLGGSHLTIVQPIIEELQSRGHNVTVFVPSRHAKTARAQLTVPVEIGHGPEGVRRKTYVLFVDSVKTGLLAMLWRTPRLIDALVMKPMVIQVRKLRFVCYFDFSEHLKKRLLVRL